MVVEALKRSNRKKLLILIVILALLGLVAFAVWYFFLRDKTSDLGIDKLEKIAYSKTLPFNPEELTDITGKPESDEIDSALAGGGVEAIIPSRSKVRIFFKTICLDRRFVPPRTEEPMLFYYEKLDTPLFLEISAYLRENSEEYGGPAHSLLWALTNQARFDDLYPEEQEVALKIDPNAKKIVDSYEFNRNITVRAFDFGEEIPQEVVAQRIPGTELFAKILEGNVYDGIYIEIYNPSNTAQTFPLVTESGVFSTVPANWLRPVDWDGLTFYLAVGQIDIKDGYLRTSDEVGAVMIKGDSGGRITGKLVLALEPGTQLALTDLENLLEAAPEEESGVFPRVARADVENIPVVVRCEQNGPTITCRFSNGRVFQYDTRSGKSREYRDCTITDDCPFSPSLMLGNAWAKISEAMGEGAYQRMETSTGVTCGRFCRGLLPDNIAESR